MIEIMGEEYPRRHKLLDQVSRNKLPKLYESEEKGLEAEALVKFFSPDSNWTWYAAEFDGEDIFYGLVAGLEVELGYFSLSELEKAKGALGLGIERDRYFEPRSLKDLIELHKQERQSKPENSEAEERRQQLIAKLGWFGDKLAQWDKRIIEIVGIGNIASRKISTDDAVQLICTFDPLPKSDSEGFFSIANLLIRADDEHLYEELGLAIPIDIGYRAGDRIYLPDGIILASFENQVRIWSRSAK